MRHDPTLILMTGCILSFAMLNLIAYLISSFYRKKFDPSAPRAGFMIALVLALIYNASILTGYGGRYAAVAVLKVLLVFGSSLASAATAASLYYAMKKVRK